MQILDATGKVIREIENISKEKGFNRAAWDLAVEGPRTRAACGPRIVFNLMPLA
jgi:hypothetical protein